MGAVIAIPLAAIVLCTELPANLIYYYKWIVSYLYIQVERRKNGRRLDFYDPLAENDPEKTAFLAPRGESLLESPISEEQLNNAIDEIICYGVNSKSEKLIVRVARGCDYKAESWIHLQLADGTAYEHVEKSGFQQTFSLKCSSFTCGGLRLHYTCPMRRWRIFYSGWLRKVDDSKEAEEMIFVKFSFVWRASSNVYDLTSDINQHCLANAFASAKWKFPFLLPPLHKLLNSLDFYAQSGIITGTVTVGESTDQEMYLFGERIRFKCLTSETNRTEFVHLLGTMPKTGAVMHLAQVTMDNVVENLIIGFIVQPKGDIKTIEEIKPQFHFTSLKESKNENDLSVSFKAEHNYDVKATFTGMPRQFKNSLSWNGSLSFHNIKLQFDDQNGYGVLITGDVFKESNSRNLNKYLPLPSKKVPLVLNFSDKASHDENATGGKGSSLGKLTELSKSCLFTVPSGFIVTTEAYKEFLTLELSEEIKTLEATVYGGGSSEEIKVACEKITKSVAQCSLPNALCQSIENQLLDLCHGNINARRFAVRSSATGEDTEQMSAAGQMDTFLGVRGLKEIFSAVKKCWASQFGFIAVEYKRQNGQLLNSPMAVVIQEMVACRVAGVLFTCDPISGNQSVLSITANYGLGESVVSGAEEPDTITLKRSADGRLEIESVVLGAKNHQIVMKDDGDVHSVELPEDFSSKCCLTNEQALDLGKLGIKIEKYYKSCRDIEWGLLNGNFYILQSRPVTSGTGETDYEIMHELDGPLRCENDYFTVCNVGEVMPGSTSPLGIDLLLKYFSFVFQRRTMKNKLPNGFLNCQYFPSGILSFYNHVMLTVIEVIFRLDSASDSSVTQGTMIGLFGRVLDDPELYAVARDRFKKVKKANQSSIRQTLQLISGLFFGGSGLDKLKKEIENYHIPLEEAKSARDIFHIVTHHCTEIYEPFVKHIICTEGSSLWNMLLFSVLGKAKGGYDSDVYSDFARLLATCSNVESADVPSAMQDLAYSISENISPSDFKSMSEQEALEWLKNSESEAGIKFRNFILRHGHRCLKEFDVYSVPWGTDSKPLIKLLQNLTGNCEKVKSKTDDDFNKILSELKVPLNFKSRCLLRFLLPNCRRAVGEREASKSILIKGMDKWRKAYHHLAEKMVSEGYIPDSQLMCFLTLEEIDEILNHRSPNLILKAKRRKRLFPEMDKYIFTEIMKGVPRPVSDQDTSEIEYQADLVMKGIPVSRGVTKGYARVAITLQEAALLKPGEILVTYSTDIGWSPYFPILAGVVTELGGLISHGAVVSREYGLPCVVGLHGATRQFVTGDYVMLDGNRGTLQRLPAPDSSK